MISFLAINRSRWNYTQPPSPKVTPYVTQDILHLWRKLGINISYPTRQGLVPHWADVEAMERVSGTAGLGEPGIDN